MKLALLTAAVLIGGATAFAPRPFNVKQSISLQISSTPGDFRRDNGYFEPKKNSKQVKKATSIKPGNWLQRKSMEDVIIDPDYYLTWCFAIVGAVITWYHPGEFMAYLIRWQLACCTRTGEGVFLEVRLVLNDFFAKNSNEAFSLQNLCRQP